MFYFQLIPREDEIAPRHFRTPLRVGLVPARGARARRGRNEMVFRPTYRQPALHHDPSPHGSSRAVTAIVASMLRLGIRDFRNASAAHRVRTAGPRRELWALRVTGWLTPAQIADINRKVHALRDAVGQPRAEGKLYAITVLLTPLQHRARKGRR